MDYNFYTPEQVKQIVYRKNYHNTTVYKSVIKLAGVKARDAREDLDIALARINDVEKRILNNRLALKDLTHSINRRMVIKLLTNYLQLREHNIDDFILIDMELQKLSGHDRLLIVGYYTFNYSYQELEDKARQNGLQITRQTISEQVNKIIDKITENLIAGAEYEQ